MSRRIQFSRFICGLLIILAFAASVSAGNYVGTVTNTCTNKSITAFEVIIEGGGNLSNVQAPAGWTATVTGHKIMYTGGSIPPGESLDGFDFTTETEPITFWYTVFFSDGTKSPLYGPVGPLSSSTPDVDFSADCTTASSAPLLGPTGLVLLAVGLLLAGGLVIRFRRAPKAS